jgi:hypothetical protein
MEELIMHKHASRTQWLMIVALMALGLAFGAGRAWGQESFSATHMAFLNGTDEVPAVPDGGQGVAFMRLDPVAMSLEYRISVSIPANDVITMAHFHRGAEGVSGPPIHTITFNANTKTATGTWTNISMEDMAALSTGGIYVNVHTERNPSGQIRSQVGPIPNFSTVQLSASREAPPVTGSLGGGNGIYWLDMANSRLIYHLEWDSLTGPPTMAHFHRGEIGVSGPVAHPIALPPGAMDSGQVDGVWDNLTGADIADLMAGKFYVNIHTAQNPGGEIRGQVLRSEFYTAAISAANEVPPSSASSMMGTGFVILSSDNSLTGLFIVNGGTGGITMAHLHRGNVGISGPVAVPMLGLNDLWFIPSMSDVPADVQAELRASGIYANFHTSEFQNGEARGQMIPAATNLGPIQAGVPATGPDAAASPIAAWYDRASNSIGFRTAAGLSEPGSRAVLFSSLGQEIADVAVTGGAGRIASSDLPSGVYFVQLRRNGAPAGFGRVAVVR